MNRGILTEEIKTKYGITIKELRLIPYFHYLLINHKPIDPLKIDSEERKILSKWKNEGKITFSMSESVTATKEFWDFMNNVLWDSYVPHYEAPIQEGE